MSKYGNFSSEQDLISAVTSRAATDAEYRQRLLDAPRTAVAEVIGIELPANLRLKFVEKDADVDAMIVLPALVDSEAELSIEELEAVAGGCWCLSALIGIIIE